MKKITICMLKAGIIGEANCDWEHANKAKNKSDAQAALNAAEEAAKQLKMKSLRTAIAGARKALGSSGRIPTDHYLNVQYKLDEASKIIFRKCGATDLGRTTKR